METLHLLEESEIQLINNSWTVISKSKKSVRNTFYSNIFEVDPKLESLFRESFLAWDSLPDSFEFMYKHMENLENVTLEIKRLGLKHKTFGVKPKTFAIGKDALVKTIDQYMGKDYTEELGNAWAKLFEYMAHYMILGIKKK